MEISPIDRQVAGVYNGLVVNATNTYLWAQPEDLDVRKRAEWVRANPRPDTAAMDEQEFLAFSLEANRQPLNPITLAREALGAEYADPDSVSEREVMEGLRQEYERVIGLYEEHGIDPEPLAIAWDVIHMTEAYIAGYSRQIDRLAQRLIIATPKGEEPYNGLDRWHNGLWVPDEDMHDRTEALITASTGIIRQEDFFDQHSRHMKIGNHVDTSGFIESNAFVALQEDATVITYQNAARIYGPVLGYMIAKIADNEAHHKRAYKSIHVGLAQEFPDETILATEKVSDEFDMPGREGIDDFEEKAKSMGYVGLLDPEATLRSQQELIGAMRLDKLEPKTDEAKAAAERLATGKNRGQRALKIMGIATNRAREKALEAADKGEGTVPLIIGETVAAPVSKDGRSDLQFIGIAA